MPSRSSTPTASPQPMVIGLGSYVPDRVMTNADWAARVDTTDEWIIQRTGIRERRFAADEESTVDFAAAAARAALTDADLEAADVGEIIVATDTPEARSPDTAAFLQHAIGAREVPSYDLGGSGCAGWVQALDVAASRVATGSDNVLVVGVEVLSRHMDWQERTTCVLFGDAAGAAILSRHRPEAGGVGRLLGVVAGTDGSQSGILGLPYGGTRHQITAEAVAERRHRAIVMDGPAVFKAAVQRMSAAAHQVLDQVGMTLDDVTLVVPHQANQRILDAVSKRLGVGPDRIVSNVASYGNTGSASIPLALCEARAAGRLEAGGLALLVSFGAGFHWAAALLEL